MVFREPAWFKDETDDEHPDSTLFVLTLSDELFGKWYRFCQRFDIDPDENVAHLIEKHIATVTEQESKLGELLC